MLGVCRVGRVRALSGLRGWRLEEEGKEVNKTSKEGRGRACS